MGIAGRQRLTWPVIEGIGATAAMLGAPDTLLKAIKRKGSRAFMTGNRVDTGILIPEIIAELLSKKSVMLDPAQEKAMLDKERRLTLQRDALIEKGEMLIASEGNWSIWKLDALEMFRELFEAPIKSGLAGLPKVINRRHKNIIIDEEKARQCAAVVTMAIGDLLDQLRKAIPKCKPPDK